MRKPPPGAPYAPVDYDLVDVAAIQAVMAGEGTPDQQRHAMRYIVENLAGAYDLSYRPSDRDTAFAEGRRFVGLQVVKLSKIRKSTLMEGTPDGGREQPD